MVRPLGPPVKGCPPDPLVTACPLAGLEVRPLVLMPRPPDPPVRVRPPRPPDPPARVRPTRPDSARPDAGARRGVERGRERGAERVKGAWAG